MQAQRYYTVTRVVSDFTGISAKMQDENWYHKRCKVQWRQTAAGIMYTTNHN